MPREIADYLEDEQALQQLVHDQVEETSRLDFKAESYPATEAGRRELRRDATALSNASGGLLILGVEDRNDVAIGVPGIDQHVREEAAVRDVLNALVTPPLDATSFRVWSVPLAGGRGVVVLEIPPARPGAPHGISENTRPVEFWIRRDKTKHRMVYDEIRERFSFDPAGELNSQSLTRIEAAVAGLRAAIATADPPGVTALRNQLQGAGYATRVYVEPISPGRFRDDVFHIKEVGSDFVMLQKESNQQSVAIPIAHIVSFAPRSGGDSSRLIALRPPGWLIWDENHWRFSMGAPATKP